MEAVTVRKISDPALTGECLRLAWEVFREFDGPDCTPEGVEEFRDFVSFRWKEQPMDFYAAFIGGELAGTLAMRLPGHISLFFVRKEHQGLGVGRALMDTMLLDHCDGGVTVNSAPYAVGIYKALGFIPTAGEQCVNGIRFTPMQRQ